MDTLELCLPFFFSEQADDETMEHQPITPAEHTSHDIAKQTKLAITWTGAVQAFIALLAAFLGLWKLRFDEKKEEAKEEKKKKKKKEEKKEEEKEKKEEEEEKKEEEYRQQARDIRDQLAALGKRLADLEVKEMVEEGKKRVEEEEMKAEKEKKKVEREKKEKRKDAANKQHEMASAALGKRLDEIEKERKAHDDLVITLKEKHEGQMRHKDQIISDLSVKNATMLRLLQVDHPEWALGVT